jgi:integrase
MQCVKWVAARRSEITCLSEEAARHSFRAEELVRLRWDQFNFEDDTLYVARVTHGSPSTHYLEAEKRALNAWRRQQGGGTFVFTALGQIAFR